MMIRKRVKNLGSAGLVLSLLACATPQHATYDAINAELAKGAAQKVQAPSSEAVAAALLPPIRIEVPKPGKPLEERFSITFNNVPAQQFFMGIVTGTPYSMLVHPEVSGAISVNLKDVTVFEALDAIRELYGYDYRVEGNRIYVKPLTMQTRVFHVSYLTGSRKGSSDIRVTSGSVSDTTTSGNTPNNNNPQLGGTNNNNNNNTTAQSLNTSKISTTSTSDFWSELKSSLDAIVGAGDGRSVVVSPQSGVVVIRAMWNDLRNVETYLKATQLAVERQVILDAKILEVELNDSYQSGINWAGFRLGDNSRGSAGMISPGTSLSPLSGGNPSTLGTTTQNAGGIGLAATPGSSLVTAANNAGSLFGLAFQTSNFAALLSFLETQGTVHVLSSPRIATLNNQKAVLKVGRDEFFVTNVSTTTTAIGNSSTVSPSVTVQPFFSGVALDVTPQIDEAGNIILHIHPSVSNVTTVDKPLNLGTAGNFTLPLASSTVSETDSVVRGKDGEVVAIGGLMRQASSNDRSHLPGAGNNPVLSSVFGNTSRINQKRELVILLKPTIVQGGETWARDVFESQQRVQSLAPPRPAARQ